MPVAAEFLMNIAAIIPAYCGAQQIVVRKNVDGRLFVQIFCVHAPALHLPNVGIVDGALGIAHWPGFTAHFPKLENSVKAKFAKALWKLLEQVRISEQDLIAFGPRSGGKETRPQCRIKRQSRMTPYK